jgi:AraC-like DNA-binding protein
MQIAYEKLLVDENSFFHHQEFIQTRFTSPFHMHDEFELIVIIKSHGKLYVGNNVTNFSDSELYLFAPGLPHCFYNTRGFEKGKELAHAVVIQFKRDFLGKDFFDKSEVSQLKKLILKSEFGVQIFNLSKGLINRVLNLNQKKDLEKLGDFLIILNELATKKSVKLLCTESCPGAAGLSDSKVINDVFKYVAENFQKELKFSTAASVANMQRAAFCRYFKRKTKKKFTEFVNETRIMHAKKLLAESDKTIFEIAYECGYQNTSYFNRHFRLLCQMTPTEFKEQISTLNLN